RRVRLTEGDAGLVRFLDAVIRAVVQFGRGLVGEGVPRLGSPVETLAPLEVRIGDERYRHTLGRLQTLIEGEGPLDSADFSKVSRGFDRPSLRRVTPLPWITVRSSGHALGRVAREIFRGHGCTFGNEGVGNLGQRGLPLRAPIEAAQ